MTDCISWSLNLASVASTARISLWRQLASVCPTSVSSGCRNLRSVVLPPRIHGLRFVRRAGVDSGWPGYKSTISDKELDTDMDGMPANWERKIGQNPDKADHNDDPGKYAYTNIEEFLNGMNPARQP